jgi:hypothetical protein
MIPDYGGVKQGEEFNHEGHKVHEGRKKRGRIHGLHRLKKLHGSY